jgi:hypothetical protein
MLAWDSHARVGRSSESVTVSVTFSTLCRDARRCWRAQGVPEIDSHFKDYFASAVVILPPCIHRACCPGLSGLGPGFVRVLCVQNRHMSGCPSSFPYLMF